MLFKIKKWLKRKFHKNKIIKELNNRIDEVIHRAESQIPTSVLEQGLDYYTFWLLGPLIVPEYIHYIPEELDPLTERKLDRTVYTILKESNNDKKEEI